MIWLLGIHLALGQSCPTTDIYAKGLDSYTIIIEEEPISLQFKLEFSQGEKARDVWRSVLTDCGKEMVLLAFEDFVQAGQVLSQLGEEWQELSWWKWKQRYLLRREISKQEKEVAEEYVRFLRVLKQETGIAVRWKPKSHPLVKGMISTAGGSDLVADYVEAVWGF